MDEEGRTVVLATGCFAAITENHVRYLEEASRHGRLSVVICSRRIVKKLKGTRAIHEVLRRRMLESLPFVHGVIIQDEDRPTKIIEYVRPDVWIKGGDYDVEALAGTEEGRAARRVGAAIKVTTRFDGESTREITGGNCDGCRCAKDGGSVGR